MAVIVRVTNRRKKYTVLVKRGAGTVVNSNNTYSAHISSGDTLVVPDSDITNSIGTYNVSLPATTALAVPDGSVRNSDNSWIAAVPAADGIIAPDIQVTDSDGSIYSYPSVKDVVCSLPVGSDVTNSDGSYNAHVNNGATLVLPDVTHTDSDGTPVVLPAMTPFVATPGGWWQRPADWLPIDNIVSAGDNKIVGLYAIFPNDSSEVAGNTLRLLCNFNYTVNWGDGVTENIAGGVEAAHIYDYDAISNATLTTEGFKQAVVTITGNGNNMNSYVQLGRPVSGKDFVNWLDIRMSGQYITAIFLPASYYTAIRLKKFVFLGATSNGLTLYGTRSSQLKVFNIDYTNLSSLSFMFYNGASFDDMGDIVSNATSVGYFMSGSYARKVGSVTLLNATSAAYAFSGCRVDEFGNIDLRAATSTLGIFIDSSVKKIGSINIATSNSIAWGFKCLELISPIVLITSPLLADCSYAFYSAEKVPEISLSDASGITNTSGMFASCNRLAKLRLPGMKTSFSVAGCNMNADALNTLFEDMADLTGFPAQTLTYSSNPGASTADASILTAKNWVAAS